MTADQRRAGLADLTRLDEEMRAPAEGDMACRPLVVLGTTAQRVISAWDTTTLKTNGDGMLCEAMEALRADLDAITKGANHG